MPPPDKNQTYHWTPADFIHQDLLLSIDAVDNLLTTHNAGIALNRAFQLRLPRTAQWNIDQLPNHLKNACLAASRIYKRGIFISNSTQNERTLKKTIIEYTNEIAPPLNTFIVVDKNVWSAWWPHIPRADLILDSYEDSKDLDHASKIFNQLKVSNAKKVFVYSGGLLADMVGFVCGLLNISVTLVPTTLLSMVDSAIGGKTGVNIKGLGKNQVGLFYSPDRILISPKYLLSLDTRDLKSGVSECLKHAFLSGDQNLWHALIEIGKTSNWNKLHAYLSKILLVKDAIVSIDPFETGQRETLNFGHTIGHALEQASHDRNLSIAFRHGEAVALGMLYELYLASRHTGFEAAQKYSQDLISAQLWPNLDEEFFESIRDLDLYLSHDKKNNSFETSYVLPHAFGIFKSNTSTKYSVTLARAWDAKIFKTLAAKK